MRVKKDRNAKPGRKRIPVTIDVDVYDRAKELADRDEVTFSGLVRRLLRQYLEDAAKRE